jgi:hypothetical protein
MTGLDDSTQTAGESRADGPTRTLTQQAVYAASLGAILGSLLFGMAPQAHAECLGIPLPEPKQLNICRTLIEDLVVPPVITAQLTCNVSGFECIFLPECCVPAACLALPECFTTEQVVQAASYIAHAGDLYCGTQDISPEQLVSDLANDRIPDVTSLSTGGLNSVLYESAGAYIDTLECQASELGGFKSVATVLMTQPDFPQKFTQVDIDNARILPQRQSGVLNLPKDGYDAITLGTLVFLRDELYDSLMNDEWGWPEVVLDPISSVKDEAMYTMIHELVHVRQYRELGRETFLNQYLPDAILNGYAQADFEEEAYSVSGHDDSWCETTVVAAREANRM